MKPITLSEIDKEELNKIEKLAGQRLPYRFPNQRGLKFQIIELMRPGYIKRRIFDQRGHCHYLIKYHLDRSIFEIIEFGLTDGHYFRKTYWNESKEKAEFYYYGHRQVSSLADVKTKLQYYGSMVREGKEILVPLEDDLKQYANEVRIMLLVKENGLNVAALLILTPSIQLCRLRRLVFEKTGFKTSIKCAKCITN